MAEKKKPTHEIRLGAIRATIWANESSSGDRWFNLIIGRSYKDDQGQWHETNSYPESHVSDLCNAANATKLWFEQHRKPPNASSTVLAYEQADGVAEQSPKPKKRRAAR